MKRLSVILFVLILGALVLFGGSTKVKILPDWNKNNNLVYQYTLEKAVYENNNVKSKYTSTGKIITKVNKIENDEIVFEMNSTDIKSNNPVLRQPEIKKFMEDSQKLTVLYRTGDNGNFIRIENVEEIKKLLTELIDIIAKKIPQNAEQYKTMMKPLLEEKNIENTYLEEIKSINNLYGYELETGKEIVNSYFIPNLFQGEPYPAKYTMKIIKIDDKAKICDGEIKIIPDEEEFRNITYKTLKNLTGKDFDKSILNKMKIDIKMEFSYDMENKVITKLGLLKDVINLNNRVKEDKTIQLIK